MSSDWCKGDFEDDWESYFTGTAGSTFRDSVDGYAESKTLNFRFPTTKQPSGTTSQCTFGGSDIPSGASKVQWTPPSGKPVNVCRPCFRALESGYSKLYECVTGPVVHGEDGTRELSVNVQPGAEETFSVSEARFNEIRTLFTQRG